MKFRLSGFCFYLFICFLCWGLFVFFMAVHKAQLNTPNLRREIKLIKQNNKKTQRIHTHNHSSTLILAHSYTQEQ